MTKVPLPRYDLVPFREYAMGCVQTSRGCPFQCEFCDIIVIFGRKPRIKTPEQVVAEIDAQHRLGARVIFLVDDNFIGNKKAAKVILRAIIDWQHQHGYPLAFFTEASLDLAEDDELMRLMAEAGLVAVFIGIESPDEEALRETKKYQNVRGSLVERVHKVQDAGLEVYAGMIVGFDSDDDDRLRPPVRVPPQSRGSSARWPACSRRSPRRRSTTASRPRAGSTTRRPTTRSIATNVIPLLMTRETLRDGWLDLMDRLYDAENYFERFDALFIEGRLPLATAKMNWLRRHRPLAYLKIQTLTILGRSGDARPDLVRPADPALSPGLRPVPPQAARRRPPAPLPVPVRLEVHHAHPLRHHDPADGPRRVAAGQHLSQGSARRG